MMAVGIIGIIPLLPSFLVLPVPLQSAILFAGMSQ